MDYGVSELDGVIPNARPVRMNETVAFQCQRCAQCCRHLAEKVMVESLDAYRIARYLRDNGHLDMTMERFYEQYTTPIPIARGYPIFTMNVCGEEEACVFLKDGRCSIYPVRPRVCRLYPFSVGPGQRGRDFEWVLCLDVDHHFHGGRVRAKDWFYQNFNREDREFVKREYASCVEIGRLLKQMDMPLYEKLLPVILLMRYCAFDVDAPFLPQYDDNLHSLLAYLHAHVDGKTPEQS